MTEHPTEDLVGDITVLIDKAIPVVRTEDARGRLAEARSRLHGPLRLAIAGKVKAGKSTLLNAILGEELAPTDAGECTKIVTWYARGLSPEVTIHPLSGPPVRAVWSREDGALDVELGERAAADVDHIHVSWPTSRLRELTIVDTPGIASISADISERTHRVMEAEDGRVPVADAVLYLMRHTHASDVRFLESFHDDELAHGTPMNSVGVLSRADEIGSCRLDAMQVADRIARRYESDVRLRRLCPIIVPVDGLLAHAASTLREAEFAMLAKLANGPGQEVDELLLTVDRLATRRTGIGLTELEREHLLDRFGLFGVRLGVELIRSDVVSTSTELASELSDRSGLDRLKTVLTRQFGQRSRVLKARSALAILTDVLTAEGTAEAAAALGAVERLRAGTHEFEEVRLLGSLRSGGLDIKPERLAELDQILGGSGHDPESRLGLEPGSTSEQIRAAALAALATWQRLAEHPLSNRNVQVAARTASRTLEGLVARASALTLDPSTLDPSTLDPSTLDPSTDLGR